MNFEIVVKNFSLKDTLFCGQCFRFDVLDDGWFVVFSGKNSSIVRQVNDRLVFKNSDADEDFWVRYFNVNVDYDRIFLYFKGDSILERLSRVYGGIRILKQDPFETLISFIISINNNIPRIKNIVSLFCEKFGEKNKNGFSFPRLEKLIDLDISDFEFLRAGFRTKYLFDAIKKLVSKDVDLQSLYYMEVCPAKEQLKKIYGVGEKVSDCVLLFSYNRLNVYPVDVWMKRVIEKYYGNGPTKQFLSCPGVAQQLLYYGIRNKYI